MWHHPQEKKILLWVVCQTFFPEVKNTVVFLNYAGKKITPSALRDLALAKIAKLAGQRAPRHLSSHWLYSGLEGRVGLRKRKLAQNVAEESHGRLSGLALVVNRLWVGWRQAQNRERRRGRRLNWIPRMDLDLWCDRGQHSSSPLFLSFFFSSCIKQKESSGTFLSLRLSGALIAGMCRAVTYSKLSPAPCFASLAF